jgi:hypothetical protein
MVNILQVSGVTEQFMDKLTEKKKLSHCIERVKVDGFRCVYTYKFSTNQWLENVDNMEGLCCFTHNEFKQILIDALVSEFKIALNSVIFGDPAGKEYIEYLQRIENEKNKI